MVSQVTLGTVNVDPTTGKTTLGDPTGSGLDTQTLLTAYTQSLQTQVTPVQDQVTLNTSKITALGQFNTLMTSLQTAAAQLSNPPGFNQQSNNAFAYVKASVSTSDGTAGSNYLSVTAQPGTTPQSYALGTSLSPAIIQLAQASQQVSNTLTATSASDPFVVDGPPAAGQIGAGTVVLNTPGGGTASITFNTGDSLAVVAANFNAASSLTGISANVVQINSNTFDLQFTSTTTGYAAAFDLGGATINSDPSSTLSGLTFSPTETAQDAEFTLNGQVIQRPTNTISDVVQGVTFNLLQSTPASPPAASNTTLNVAIAPDTTTAENGVVGFINAYNNLMQFYAQQTQINSDGTYAATAVLAQDPALNTAISSLQSKLANIVTGLPNGAFNALGQLGITFTTVPAVTDSSGNVTTPAITNALTYNQSTLESALASNFNQVQQVFGFTFSSSNSNLVVNTRTNALAASSFTVNIDPVSNTFQATYVDANGSHTIDLDASAFSSGKGYVLNGPAGSALDGLSMLYGSTSAASGITVTATQGIADWINNFATSMTTANTGTIAADTTGLKTSNTSLNNTITQINQQNATKVQFYQNELSQLEQALASANAILATLTAEQNAALSNTSQG